MWCDPSGHTSSCKASVFCCSGMLSCRVGFAGRLLSRPRVMIVATHADTTASVTDERRSVSDASSVVVDTVAVKFADDFDVVERLFVVNCLRPTYTELKSLRLCLAEMRTAIVSVSLLFTSTTDHSLVWVSDLEISPAVVISRRSRL